jgi:hypothetical protein
VRLHTLSRFACVFAGLCFAADAGILITRTDKGLQFTEAVSVLVNGKDKALVLGAEPKLTGPMGKLKDAKLSGSLVKDEGTKTIGAYEAEEMEYLLPENLPKGGPTEPAEIWRAAKIAYKKTANEKAPTDVPVAAFVAFLAGGPEELTRFCLEERALELVGGKGKTFATQLEWIAAVVQANTANPAMAPLEKFVENSLRGRFEQFETGTAGLEVLDQAMKLAELSQKIYPNQPGQTQLRNSLAQRKEWLDRKIAILRAFAAAQEWDALLLGGREFERYEQVYPEIGKQHTDALKQSLTLHRDSGELHLKEGEYAQAWREFRLASMRQPSDGDIHRKVLVAWTDYSRQAAIDEQRNRKQISAGDRVAIGQALSYADGYQKQNKLDQALKSVLDAEKIDRTSLPVLIKKAEILGAQRDFTKALETLDRYDRLAVNDERKRSEDLRSELSFKRTSTLEDIKGQTQKAWNEMSFHKLLALTSEGLRCKDDDPDLLYQAGLAALATRDVKQGREYLSRYLEISNTLDAVTVQRARVRTVLANINPSAAAEQGDVNWMSGKKLAKGVFYDPISLAFQPRVDRIDAGKLKVAYQWDGEKLKAIVPSFDKNQRLTGEQTISFRYEERVPQIASVALEDAPPAAPPSDPDDRFRRSSLVVLNNPYVDPIAVERLTGKNVTVGIAGNRFFNPFIWEKVYYFRLVYDAEGRVVQAREITDTKTGALAGVMVEFEWDGMQLAAVHGYQGNDRRAPKIYDRTMQYQDGRLISEEIRSQGKTSRTKYIYNAGRLVSAECTNDPLDSRSRKVAFLANSPTTLVK